jgi:septal ring factor EnvC (AmiA/AmiB activator)
MRVAAKFLPLLLISLFTVGSSQSTWAEDEQVARQKLTELAAEMQSLRKLTTQFKADRSELQTALSKAEHQIGQLNREIRNTGQRLRAQQHKLSKLQEDRQALQLKKQQQQSLIEQQIRAAYQLGQENKLKVLLSQEKPEELNRMLAYYDYFNSARLQEIEDYTAIIEQLDAIEPEINATTLELNASRQALQQQHRSLSDSKAVRQRHLAKINAALLDNEQQLKQMLSDRRHLEELLSAMEETIANLTIPNDQPFKLRKGKLPWPVKGRLAQRFGKYRSGGKLRWEGVILKAVEGSEVQAIHHGRVIFADWFRGSGLLVILDHGDGYMSLYAHNQSLLIETGEWVNAGDNIATVGNSGGRQQAGLYFEIRHNGKPSNPQQWCKRS